MQRFIEQHLHGHGFPPKAGCAEMVVRLLEPNPRKIKNFVNSAGAAWGLFSQQPAAGSGDDDEEGRWLRFARRFILFRYLRLHHKQVWRLLERQRWALQILYKVLLGGMDQDLRLPDNVSADDQRVLEALLFRCFAHVLRDTGEEQQAHMHRHLPLGEAVDLLNQRLDRKRSDERFIRYFRELIPPGIDLPEVAADD